MPWTLLCSVAVSVNKNVERKRETLRWNHIEPKGRNATGLWRETGAKGRETTWSPDSFPELIPSFCSLCFLLILGLHSGSSVQAEQESVSQSKYVGKRIWINCSHQQWERQSQGSLWVEWTPGKLSTSKGFLLLLPIFKFTDAFVDSLPAAIHAKAPPATLEILKLTLPTLKSTFFPSSRGKIAWVKVLLEFFKSLWALRY